MSLERIKSSSQLRVEGPGPFQYAQRMQFSCGENGQAIPRMFLSIRNKCSSRSVGTHEAFELLGSAFFQTGKEIDDHLEMVTETRWVLI